MKDDLDNSIEILNQGGIIAYPTEAVYGFGCDPLHEISVMKLLALKKRSVAKGLILIAANWEQLSPYLQPIALNRMKPVLATWPGPVTWVFPAAEKVPHWIRGSHSTIAVRITAHPLARSLCEAFGRPLVSTSANVEGEPPAKEAKEIVLPVDFIIEGQTGGLSKPTEIRDALNGKVIRAGIA
jgi:L-threonylcarbamoyladenylate synthase